jgi:hypothetical protein
VAVPEERDDQDRRHQPAGQPIAGEEPEQDEDRRRRTHRDEEREPQRTERDLVRDVRREQEDHRVRGGEEGMQRDGAQIPVDRTPPCG